MSANTTPSLKSVELSLNCKDKGYVVMVYPNDFVKFIYNNEVRIGRVERVTSNTILVETKDGFRSFKLNQITKENDEVHIVKYRGAMIRWNGNNWEADSGEVVRLENIDEYPPTNFFHPIKKVI